MRKTALILVVLALFPVHAFSAEHHDTDKKVVAISIGNDLYTAGGSVVVAEPVEGDLQAAGGSLIVNAPVGEDLQAAGGSVVINGTVGDDLRAVGGDVTLASNVNGDVVIYGGSVIIPAGVVVEGDAVVGSGTLNLGGTINGDLRVDAGTVVFSGTVRGNAGFYGQDRVDMNGRVEGETVFAAREAVLGPAAGFGGDVTYWRQEGEMDFGQKAASGTVLFSPDLKREDFHGTGHGERRVPGKGVAAVFSVFFLGTLLSGILSIAIGIALFKRIIREAGEVLHLSFWKGFGVGILTYLLLPVGGALAIFTLIGIPVGLLLLTLFVFSLLLGRVITAMVIAAWVERRRTAHWSPGRLMAAAMGIFILIKLASLVPFLGWIVVVLATVAGYGALVVALMESRRPAF